jgi:aminobenzoyl-glutamate transport protein
MDPKGRKRRGLDRLLAAIERGGNALPHPALLFLILALLVILLSELAVRAGFEAVHPKDGTPIRPVSLLTRDGLHRILTRMVTNFTGFAPLGTVLVALLGIGLAEASGLIGTVMRAFVGAAPRRLLTAVVVLAGVLSNVGSEIGYVLLVPLAATIFQAAGRHPIAGLAAAFAGVSGGYSANILLGTVDPLLSGITEEAARLGTPGVTVSAACNYYFMCASTLLVTVVCTAVTTWVVIPRLGPWTGEGGAATDSGSRPLTTEEHRGLLAALLMGLVLAGILLLGTVPRNGFLRNPKDGDLLDSPFLKGIVALIFLSAALMGLAYGWAAGTLRSGAAAIRGMSRSMETMGSYLVLVFFAAQFVAYFDWTKLGSICSVKGAEAISAMQLGPIPVVLALVLFTAFANLFMGSASAKWVVMAPIFVPMFSHVGIPPETTQAAYRVGDSATNIISPMMSYFALIISYFQRYDPRAGIGTLVGTMLPYSVAILVAWTIFLAGWLALGLPMGPAPAG